MNKISSKFGLSAVVLLLSGFICKALGALFRLPLTNLLGIEGIGIFQLVMSLYAFALVVTCGGVTNSLSKLISSARARGEHFKVTVFLRRAFVTTISVALLIGALFLGLGKQISAFQEIEASSAYMLFLLLLPLGAGLATLRGFFQGYENMFPTAISQILEQVGKFAFGLLFAYFFSKGGVSQGVFGAFLGIVLSEIVSLVYLLFLYVFKGRKIHGADERARDMAEVKIVRKEFDKANFLLMLSASVLPLVSAFDGLVIVPRLMIAGFSNSTATTLFGLQAGVVGAILNFPLIISIAVTTALLPNISYALSRGTNGRHIIERGLKVLLFLILPTTFGMVAISRPVLALLYKDMSAEMLEAAFNLMLYGGFSIIFTALMQYLIMLLQANGEYRFILIITVMGGVAKAELSFFLSSVASINIYALVLGNIALSAIVCVLALWKLKRHVAFSVRANDLFALLFGTSAMFLTVYTFIKCDYFHPAINIILGIFLGVVVYCVLTTPFSIKILKKERRFAR